MNVMTDSPELSRMGELRRGWRPLVASCFGIALGLSPHSAYTIGIMASAMNADLAWSRGDILGATMIGTLAVILLGSTIGRAVDRLGARRVAIASTIGVSLGLFLLSTVATNIYIFYILWGLLTVLGLGTLPMTYANIVGQWFNRARGMALGIALASTGIAGAIYPFFLDFLIDGSNWRSGFLGLASLPLLISLPIQLLWLREPGKTREGTATVEVTGLTLKEAIYRYRFWASAFAAMLLNFASGGLLPNFLPLLTEGGLTVADATRALAVMALSITAGRLLCGFMLD